MPKDLTWIQDPRIRVCKDMCERFAAQQAILITVDASGHLQGSSYGTTRALCAKAERLLDAAMDAIEYQAD